MPIQKSKKAIDPHQALEAMKAIAHAKNMADFSEITTSIMTRFGGPEGIAGELWRIFNTLKQLAGDDPGMGNLDRQREVLKMVLQVASRNAEMQGNYDVWETAKKAISDDELNKAIRREMEALDISPEEVPAITHDRSLDLTPTSMESSHADSRLKPI